MTDTHEKLRALFLAALMVISVFAVTVSLSGSATAASEGAADDTFINGGTFWQGQEVHFDGSGIVNASDSTSERTFEIWTVDTDNSVPDQLVSQFVVDADNAARNVETDNLDGRYVIVHQGEVVDLLATPAKEGDDTTTGHSFVVTVQDLSASFDEDDVPVTEGDTATMELSSNRGAYTVNITADGLDEGDLEDIFGQGDNDGSGGASTFVGFTGSDDDDDDSVQVNIGSDEEIVANFSVFDDPGDYTFDLEVNDSTASASASAEVQEEDVGLDFSSGVYSDQIGDKVEVTVQMEDTDEAWIYIGGDDVNYLERVHVEDDDDDGEVTIELNTALMGWNESNGIDGNGRDYDGNGVNDTGIDVTGDDVLGDDGIERFNSTQINDNPDSDGEIDDIDDILDEALEEGDYGLTVASDGDAPTANDDDELSIPGEEDVATLDLTARSTDGISIWTAPNQDIDNLDVDDGELDDVLNEATETGTVAEGDLLIVEVQASGIFGALDEDDNQLTDNAVDTLLADNDVEQLSLFVEEADAGANQAGAELNLDSGNSAVYTAPGDNRLYLLVDSDDVNNFDEDSYTASFRVGEDDEDGAADADDPYESPYLDNDEEELVEGDFDIADADAEFDNMVDEEVQVASSSEATVSGTTNVAPNEELTIRLRRTDDPAFLITQEEVVVQSDGTWSTTFDTSDIAVDTTFEATVRRGTETISDTEDGVIVEEMTETPEPTPEPTEEPTEMPTEEPTEEPTEMPTEEPTEPPTDTPTETDGQPGFGIAIALVALLAAALLALRRRD